MKVILRRAKAHQELDNLDESFNDFKKVLELDSSNAEARYAVSVSRLE